MYSDIVLSKPNPNSWRQMYMSDQFVNEEVTSDDKLWALLAYLFTPLVPVIILLMEDKKNRPYLKAHNIQALVFGLVYWVLGSLIAVFTLGIGSCLIPLLWILAIYWGIQAYQGKYVTIPVITNFVKKQGWA
jgi:uncharacterized protein